jgi:hypothetical protein
MRSKRGSTDGLTTLEEVSGRRLKNKPVPFHPATIGFFKG